MDPEWWGFEVQGCPVCRDSGVQGSRSAENLECRVVRCPGDPRCGEGEFQGIYNTKKPRMLGCVVQGIWGGGLSGLQGLSSVQGNSRCQGSAVPGIQDV